MHPYIWLIIGIAVLGCVIIPIIFRKNKKK